MEPMEGQGRENSDEAMEETVEDVTSEVVEISDDEVANGSTSVSNSVAVSDKERKKKLEEGSDIKPEVVEVESDNDDDEAEKNTEDKETISDEKYYSTLSSKELKYLKKHILLDDELEKTAIICTACYKQVNHKQEGAVMRHVDLGVPICKRCRKFYHNGEWTKDEEGYYEHCRWCANGGDLLCCDSCPNSFCKKCIKRNLGRSKVSEIEDAPEWKCLSCAPEQIYKQRAMYYSIWTYNVKESITEEEQKEREKGRENVMFVDEAHKDGAQVNKIFGNYLQKSVKSWLAKSDEKIEKDDVTKLVVKFRTFINIAHHNLDLLDKNLVNGCISAFPDVTEDMLKAMPIPSDDEGNQNGKKEANKSEKLKKKNKTPKEMNSNDMSSKKKGKKDDRVTKDLITLENGTSGSESTKGEKGNDSDVKPQNKTKHNEKKDKADMNSKASDSDDDAMPVDENCHNGVNESDVDDTQSKKNKTKDTSKKSPNKNAKKRKKDEIVEIDDVEEEDLIGKSAATVSSDSDDDKPLVLLATMNGLDGDAKESEKNEKSAKVGDGINVNNTEKKILKKELVGVNKMKEGKDDSETLNVVNSNNAKDDEDQEVKNNKGKKGGTDITLDSPVRNGVKDLNDKDQNVKNKKKTKTIQADKENGGKDSAVEDIKSEVEEDVKDDVKETLSGVKETDNINKNSTNNDKERKDKSNSKNEIKSAEVENKDDLNDDKKDISRTEETNDSDEKSLCQKDKGEKNKSNSKNLKDKEPKRNEDNDNMRKKSDNNPEKKERKDKSDVNGDVEGESDVEDGESAPNDEQPNNKSSGKKGTQDIQNGLNEDSKKQGPDINKRNNGKKETSEADESVKSVDADVSKDMFDNSSDDENTTKPDDLPELDEANQAAKASLLETSSDDDGNHSDQALEGESEVEQTEKKKSEDERAPENKSVKEDESKKASSPKKKLKTKKELDSIRKHSAVTADKEDSDLEDQSNVDSNGDCKGVEAEKKSSDDPSKIGKKSKDKSKTKKFVAAFTSSDSDEDSDEDRLGIASLSPETKKMSKQEEKKKREQEEKKQMEREEKKQMKKDERRKKEKEEYLKKMEEKKKRKEEKKANGHSNDKDADETKKAESSDNSNDNMDEKKKRKLIKIIRKKKIKELRKKAAEIDPNTAQLSKMESKVDVIHLTEEIKQDLKTNEVVDVSCYPELFVAKEKDEEDDIDKLCDLGSLKSSRKVIQEDGSTDSEDDVTLENGSVKRTKKEKVKADGVIDMSSGSDENDSGDDEESDKEPKKDASTVKNDVAKASVLDSSESGEDDSDESDDDETKPNDEPKKSKDKKDKKRKERETEGSETEKPKSKKLALLTMKLSEDDSSDDDDNDGKKKNDDSSDSSDIGRMSTATLKGTARQKALQKRKRALADTDEVSDSSDSEKNQDSDNDSDSDVGKKKKAPKKGGKKKKSSSSDEDSDEEDRPKRKRRRIKKGGTDDEDDEDGDKASPTKRHNVRKVIKDKNLEEETKTAAAEEKERRKRVQERQEKYNKTFGRSEEELKKGAVVNELVLDFNEETNEVLVEVHKKLAKQLKPHQVGGIKFMWDTCFESLAQIEKGKNPGGAILAHCMGLGKTLQSVTLTHTVMSNDRVGVNRTMVICPVNVVKNWEDEFEKWLVGDLDTIDVYQMSKEKDNKGRADKLESWFEEGGVLLIGYDMFRNLVNPANKKFKKKQKETFTKCLLDPGPDLVICDEGHLLKNEKSAINKAVNRIKTPRRIVLTGTPLQNNLKEYYEMVNFVKPSLIGTRKEFMNRFVNPIVNGQHSDSTERDVKMMKKRSFILNDLLKGCMQRLDYNVLVPYLMPKHEYVLTIQMTDLQKTLYKYYLENYAKAGQIGADGKLEGGKKGGLFYDVQNLSRIWNHPYILLLSKMRKDAKELDTSGDEGSLKDFIDDGDSETSESEKSTESDDSEDDKKPKSSKRTTRADRSEQLVDLDDKNVAAKMSGTNAWWNQFLKDDQNLEDMALGSKMVLLLDILNECAMIGDKLLIFSQSILSLDLIEEFLAKIHSNHENSKKKDKDVVSDYLETWVPGKDYYRMDGSTAADTRKIWCKYFNKDTNHRMRLFLISTKAGGLGINLVAANRVIIFDASWNPSHDVQSIFRVFRFGQTKPVYIYRFLAKGTMEEKIYDRQVTKQSLSARVVDEQQIESHFTMNELSELYEFNDEPLSARPIPIVPEDRLLAELVDKHKETVWNIHCHDSLLENKVEENLTEDERKHAWDEFENEKKGFIQQRTEGMGDSGWMQMMQKMMPQQTAIQPMAIQAHFRQLYPQASHEDIMTKTRIAVMQLQNEERMRQQAMIQQQILLQQNPHLQQQMQQMQMQQMRQHLNQQQLQKQQQMKQQQQQQQQQIQRKIAEQMAAHGSTIQRVRPQQQQPPSTAASKSTSEVISIEED